MPQPREFHVALTRLTHDTLMDHLRREDGDEDLTFATWTPSTGASRDTVLLTSLILPEDDERERHGNVHFKHPYLRRAASVAEGRKEGLALLHSHPEATTWQRLSSDDRETEGLRVAPFAASYTGFPFVGLTLSTGNGFWSARRWERRGPNQYEPHDADAVRVVGAHVSVSFNPKTRPAPRIGDDLRRTISVWGDATQKDISRLRVGIVGLGSVGSIVAEALARIGVTRVKLIDFDDLKPHNRDRTLHATAADAKKSVNKAELSARSIRDSATVTPFFPEAVNGSVVTKEVGRHVIDCDILFSCVDRPWPRHVLNAIAYAHLIPVIDGGIIVRFIEGRFDGMDWRCQTAGPERACLQCTRAYRNDAVGVERAGQLDDPEYIKGLTDQGLAPRSENIFPLSLGLAAQEMHHFTMLVAQLKGQHDVGLQRWHYYPPFQDSQPTACLANCDFQHMIAKGDGMPDVYGTPAPPKEEKLRKQSRR